MITESQTDKSCGGLNQSLQYPDRILDYEALGLVKNGKPRLSYAQAYFTRRGIDLGDPDVRDLLVGLYKHWRSLPEYLIFEGEHQHTGEKKWGAGLMSKRGNQVYRKNLRKRLGFIESLEDHMFFNYKDRSSRRQTSRALFITLTYDSKLAPLWEAWHGVKIQKQVQRGPNLGRIYEAHKPGCKCVSCFYNRYITALREAYGRLSVIRAWEGFESGYPHVHMVVLFHEHEFPVFHYGGSWRVQGKQDSTLEAYGGGFTDVEALASLRGGLRYVTKYLSKIHGGYEAVSWDQDGSTTSNFIEATTHGDFTMSVMWLFRKRAYSISGDFIEFTRDLCNSKSGPRGPRGQVDLEGLEVWVWCLKGYHTGLLPGVSGVPWSHRLDLKGIRAVTYSPGYSARDP